MSGRREGHSENVASQLIDYNSDLDEDDEIDGDEDSDRSGSSTSDGDNTDSSQVQVLETSAAVENESTILQRQSQLRKQILAIHEDKDIPAADKAKRIQSLMTSAWKSKQATAEGQVDASGNGGVGGNTGPSPPLDSAPQYHDKSTDKLGCKHYIRGTKILSSCCNKWFVCRLCHDETSSHTMDRKLTKTMMCMHCSTIQPVSNTCKECNKQMARYFCEECRLWDDDPGKDIYHCQDCGICRRGKGLGNDYFHCAKCNICMAISLQGNHKCIERNLESDCPICGEYLFTSTNTVVFLRCGHSMHYKCNQDYQQTSSYQCPTCFKSLRDMTDLFERLDAMLAQHQMPPEYANTISKIYCNDCEEKSDTKFHFLYHKCQKCGSYNTKVLGTADHSS